MAISGTETATQHATSAVTSSAASKPTLAAVVIARDEAGNITECLRSIAWADQLCVLLDSRTRDATAELARNAGAEVRSRPFKDFADQRNAALDMFPADWILFVDADERGTPQVATEVRKVISENNAVGWWIPRRNYIWGRWIQHTGWYPDYQLRLLKRGHARYDPTREVHELVILDGPEGHLRHPLTHYNYSSVRQFISKQDYYANYEARILLQSGICPRLHSPFVQPLREFKRRFWTLQGYRDGGHGVALSLLMAYYSGVAYWRALVMWRRQAQRQPGSPTTS